MEKPKAKSLPMIMYIYTHTHTFILMYIHVYPLCTVSDTDFTFIGVIQFPFLYTKQMS